MIATRPKRRGLKRNALLRLGGHPATVPLWLLRSLRGTIVTSVPLDLVYIIVYTIPYAQIGVGEISHSSL